VVHVELTDVYWFEATVLAVVFSVYFVWVLQLVNVAFVDCLAPISTRERVLLVSEFNLGVATD
jgi:hypothetical protein